jgi:hypothetical protein
MSAPSYCIFDGDGGSNAPALPTDDCENVGGGLLFTNNVDHPPRSHEHPSADDWHQMEQLIARMSRTGAPLTLWCSGNAVPTVDTFRCWSDNVTTGNFSITRGAVGSYTVTVTAGVLWDRPSASMTPKSGPTGTASVGVTVAQTTNTFSIKMNDTTGAATDAGKFWIDIFGF